MSSPTMMPMSLEEIAQAVQGRLIAGTAAIDTPVATSTFTDSRQIVEGSVFVAIAGERVDGHDYVSKVGAQGAVAAIVDHEIDGAGVPQIVVEDTVLALGALAKHNIERRRALETPFTVIGITGSVGKTTTKDLMKALLAHIGPTIAPVGSFNNEIGLPLTSLKVHAETRFLIAEMGANHVGEIANLTSLVPPDIAVVLKVGVAHLGEFGSPERIAQAKSEIIRGLVPGGLSILNANDEHVAAMSAIAPGDVMWFGLPQNNDGKPAISAQHVHCDELDHPSFILDNGDGEHAELFGDDDAHAVKTLEHRLGIHGDGDGVAARNSVFVVEKFALEAAADQLGLSHFKENVALAEGDGRESVDVLADVLDLVERSAGRDEGERAALDPLERFTAKRQTEAVDRDDGQTVVADLEELAHVNGTGLVRGDGEGGLLDHGAHAI